MPLLLLLACVSEEPAPSAAPPLPDALPALVVTRSEPGSHVAGGHLLLSLVSAETSFVGVVDGAGGWAWATEAVPTRTFASPRLGLDGDSVLYASYDRDRADDDGTVVRAGLDGVVRSVTGTSTAHHMFAEQGDGTLAWLSLEGREVPWDGGTQPVLADRILVAPEGSDEPAPDARFSFFDDVGEPYVPCTHAQLRIDRFGWLDHFEWTHSNSLVHLPEAGAWLLASRHLDAVVAVDVQTGEVRWQLGGRDATLTPSDPALLPSHPHLSDAWDGGALVFDNGVHREPQVSRVVRWSFDPDAGTATPEWVYTPPDDRYAYMLGDARRLPDDHVLIAWSVLNQLQEVTPSGEVVWEAELDPHHVIGRVGFLDELP